MAQPIVGQRQRTPDPDHSWPGATSVDPRPPGVTVQTAGHPTATPTRHTRRPISQEERAPLFSCWARRVRRVVLAVPRRSLSTLLAAANRPARRRGPRRQLLDVSALVMELRARAAAKISTRQPHRHDAKAARASAAAPQLNARARPAAPAAGELFCVTKLGGTRACDLRSRVLNLDHGC